MFKKNNALSKLLLLFILLFIIFIKKSFALEPLYLQLIVNNDKKGDFLFYIEEENFYIKMDDIAKLGLREIIADKKDIEGEEYISLKSLKGLEKIELLEISSSLLIEIDPKLLDKKVIDFHTLKKGKVYYPKNERSLFLNYRVDYTGRENFQHQAFYLTNELGLNFKNLLFLTETSYERNNQDSNFVRLNTSIYKDDRKKLTRLIVGDFFTPSDPFSGGINVGGISYSKNYRIDPYFIYRPTLTIHGAAKNKSFLEVYLDGVPIKKEYLPAGEYELRDIYYYQGQRNIEVIVKDSYGRVEREIYPFYFSDRLLKEGISEFSYNLGFVRKNYGIKSNDYEDLIINFYHRYGYSERINLGISYENHGNLFYISPELSYSKANLGVLSLKVYLNKSEKPNSINYAFLTNYSYQKKRFIMD